MFKKVSIILLTFLLVLPVLAQDFAEQLNIVNAAIENTFNTSSFRIENVSEVDQVIGMEISNTPMSITQTIDTEMEASFRNEDGAWDSSVVMYQDIVSDNNGMAVEITQTMEMILLDDVVYLRYSDLIPAYMESSLPTEWVELSEAKTNPQYLGLATIREEFFYTMLEPEMATMQFMIVGLTEETVTSIEMLESDDSAIEIYQLEINADAMLTPEYMSQMLGNFDLSALGVSMDDIEITLGDDTVMIYTFYIGVEDKLVHQLDSEVSMVINMDGLPAAMGGSLEIDQTATSTTYYLDYDAEVEIEKPELGN
jgi:hypothetical protein